VVITEPGLMHSSVLDRAPLTGGSQRHGLRSEKKPGAAEQKKRPGPALGEHPLQDADKHARAPRPQQQIGGVSKKPYMKRYKGGRRKGK